MDPDTSPDTPQGFHLASDASGLTLHIPPLPDPMIIAIWTVAIGVLLFLALALIRAWTNRAETAPRIARRWRGLKIWFQRHYLTILIPLGFLAVGWAIAAYLWQIPTLIGQMLRLLKAALRSVEEANADTATIENIRTLAYTFAALAGMLAILATIPFQLVRVWINERTAKTQEANLTTSLINTAVEGLGAEKKVSRIGRTVKLIHRSLTPEDDEIGIHRILHVIQWRGEDISESDTEHYNIAELGEWQSMEQTIPNIEVRVGAILTLDRIARENPGEHIRVMDILCAYIRENAPAKDAKDHPFGLWPAYPENPTVGRIVEWRAQLESREEDMRDWIDNLPRPRTDIQTAVTTIGNRDPERINREEAQFARGGETGYRLDLRETNLRKCDLSHLNLNRARFAGARMEGARLVGAQVKGANFFRARMEGANLSGAHLEGANLVEARMEGADLVEARMEGADLVEARMDGAVLRAVRLDDANLTNAQMEAADLREARMKGTNLRDTNIQGADLSEARMQGASFFQTTLNGSDLQNAQLQGATFTVEQMQGANLEGANLQTVRWGIGPGASAARNADLRGVEGLRQADLDEMIGNEATLLPERPAPDTKQPFSIPSCWQHPPGAFVEMMDRYNPVRNNDLDDYHCPPGQEPARTGTPLPLDAPYPPGHPLADLHKTK